MESKMVKGEAYLNINRLYKKTISYSKKDPEVAVILARKTTESICKFIYFTHVSENPTTLMLDKLLQQLTSNKAIPKKILNPMRTVQSYGNFGTHDQDNEYEIIDEVYARPCIDSLGIIMEWFKKSNSETERAFNTKIYGVGLSKRTVDILKKAKLTSLAILCLKIENELLAYHGLGKATLFEIKEVLATHGLSLGMKFDIDLVEEMNNIRFT